MDSGAGLEGRPGSGAQDVTVAVIGGGFAGIGMAYYLKAAGISSFAILEKGSDLGGTWRDNTYPGAGCDVPSHLYSFSFESGYPWARRYAAQPEILAYLHHCVDKFELLPYLRFDSEVRSARFNEQSALWTLEMADGESLRAQFVISAVGQLHRPARPDISGLSEFQGESFHSACWDHGLVLEGKRVAVIGTGASAVQFVPQIVDRVAHLDLYQRSPGWVIPKAEKRFSESVIRLFQRWPRLHELDRKRIFAVTEAAGYAYAGNRLARFLLTSLARLQLWRQVRDKPLRRSLTPDYPVGCKRILLSNDWLPALTHKRVALVTDPILKIGRRSITTEGGIERPADVLIFSTGFHATRFLESIQVRGLGGVSLSQAWGDQAVAYLGMSVPGFPNFFMLYGPNTNLGAGSIIFMLECQQRYLVEMVRICQRRNARQVAVTAASLDRFAREIRERSAKSSYEADCSSWYKGADGVNTNNWVGSMTEYRRRTRSVAPGDYHFVVDERAA